MIDDGGTMITDKCFPRSVKGTVNHKIFLDKFSYYHNGINNVTKIWFAVYLNDRKQYMCIDGVDSDILHLHYELPRFFFLVHFCSLYT